MQVTQFNRFLFKTFAKAHVVTEDEILVGLVEGLEEVDAKGEARFPMPDPAAEVL